MRIIHDLKQDQVDVVEHPSECVTVAMRVSEGHSAAEARSTVD